MKSIMSMVKRRTRTALLDRGVYLGHATELDLLQSFLSAIRPIRTQYDLIRVGGDGDGGYLVPNDLEAIEICFSPGVSDVANFEQDLARMGIQCFLADYSVDSPPINNALFDFEKKYLGPSDDDKFMTLESWITRKAPNKNNFILQMDIEGAEYGVIFDTRAETLRKFRILVIEFHNLDGLCDRLGFELINLSFEKILKDFQVIHIHPNNCCPPIRYKDLMIPPVMEFTFIRKDRISSRQAVMSFPHKLDRKNVLRMPDLTLPECWYR